MICSLLFIFDLGISLKLLDDPCYPGTKLGLAHRAAERKPVGPLKGTQIKRAVNHVIQLNLSRNYKIVT